MTGKYYPLERHLTKLPHKLPHKAASLNFADIQALIHPEELPKSAFEYRAWWSNDQSHVQARAWINAGFKTADVDLLKLTVAFAPA